MQTVVPYRGDELEVRFLRVMGDVGQIVPQFFTLKDYDSVYKTVKDSDVVFNLIGRDYETRSVPLPLSFFLSFFLSAWRRRGSDQHLICFSTVD